MQIPPSKSREQRNRPAEVPVFGRGPLGATRRDGYGHPFTGRRGDVRCRADPPARQLRHAVHQLPAQRHSCAVAGRDRLHAQRGHLRG